jgi:hypothetical protein
MVRPFAYDNSLEKLLRNELLPAAKYVEKGLLLGQPLVLILIDLAFSEPLTPFKETLGRVLAEDRPSEAGLAQAAIHAEFPAEKDFWGILAKGALTVRQRETMRMGLHHFYEANLREINLVRTRRLRTRQRQRVIKWAALPTISTALLGASLAFVLYRHKAGHERQAA